jgi:hypothetical protein
MKEKQMKSSIRPLIVGALALMIAIPAFAQTPEYSVLPVAEPLLVGDTVLQPGTYTIRVVPSLSGRNRVQVTSPDLSKVYATVLTVPHPLEPNEEVPNTTFIYYPATTNRPAALRTWFAPHPEASQGGHDIVYEEDMARSFAVATRENVVFIEEDTPETAFDDTPIQIITPEERVETYVYVPPPPPVVIETPAPMVSSVETIEMPDTASNVPMTALLGLLAIATAIVIRQVR